jgi:hypothetical protein
MVRLTSIRRATTMRALVLAALALALLAAAGCGGGEKQDADEPEGTWKVEVVDASFPGRQRLADESELRIEVRNADSRAIPNLAVTVDGFGMRKENQDVSDPQRPIWTVVEAPDNSGTSYTNTWAVGEVPKGQTRTLVWKVSAVRAGTYTLRFRVAAGLNGKAKAVSPDGSAPSGSFIARVSEKPHPVKVD